MVIYKIYKKSKTNDIELTPPTHHFIKAFFFGNPSLTWTEHSNHNDQQLLITYIKIHLLYYPPSNICTTWPLYDYIRTIFQQQNQSETWTNPSTPFQSYDLGFEGELDLLVNKISFFLDFSGFCTFYAENHPGTTQKKWQQGFSCLEM